MAEALTSFVSRRQPSWATLESLLERQRAGTLHLEELISLERHYRQASADLARARAFYAGTEVQGFLNQLCGRAYRAIYRSRPARLASIAAFFRTGFPAVVRANLRYTQAAAGLLALGVIVGFTTVSFEPDGVRLLVSDDLRAFIDRGELWTDSALGALHPSTLAVMIFTNNLRVTFAAFSLGITAGIGTLITLLFNGLHIGALVAACAQHDLAGSLLAFMSAHGPVELSVICMTGGAGLMLGHAMIEPQERPRGEILREQASAAVQQVVGCAPFLVLIGVVEGFISPGSFFPWPAKVAIGALTGLGFWRYLLR
jgi:uncharacterized membrane protein SpoIIM required for sporulation